MPHQRTTVRNALIDLLKGTAPSYATNAQDRVYANRVHNLATSKLPAIIVSDEEENATPRDASGRLYYRTWSVNIEAFIEATSNYATTLDNLVLQIEDLLKANPNISSTAIGTIYISTQFSFEPAEKPIAKATINYQIKYIS